MKYCVCKSCRNLLPETVSYCLFCGRKVRRRAKRVRRVGPDTPLIRRTASSRMQRAMTVFACFAAVVTVAFTFSGCRGTSSGEPLVSPSPSAAPTPSATPTPSADPTPTVTPEAENPFLQVGGYYSVVFFMSDITSDDPEIQPYIESALGSSFEGGLYITIDGSGNGTIQLDDEHFTSEPIPVSPLSGDDGSFSNNTIYGTVPQCDMQLSIACICSETGVSGFVWLDNELTHYELLYFCHSDE